MNVWARNLLIPSRGAITPDRMICGMTATGISVMAISSVGAAAEIARPRATPAAARLVSTKHWPATAPGGSAPELDDDRQDQGLHRAEEHQQQELGAVIAPHLDVEIALARVDDALLDDLLGGVVAAEPEAGHRQQEQQVDRLAGRVRRASGHVLQVAEHASPSSTATSRLCPSMASSAR